MPATMAQTVSVDLAHTYGMPNTTRQSGIYVIENAVTGGFYIGSAVNFTARFGHHLWALRGQRHGNPRLQRAWNKYGPDAFRFTPMAYLDRAENYACEERLLAKLVGLPLCYNISRKASGGRPGVPHTEDARAKMSASASRWQLGRALSESTKDKLRAFNTGKKRSPESIRKSVESRAGYTASQETRAKISKAKRGQPLPVNHPAWGGTWNVGRKHHDDSIEKMRAASTGRTHTPEARAKISAKAKGRTLSPEHKAKLREANTGRVKSEAEREKISDGRRGHVRTPDMRERDRAARLAWWERKRQETA